MINQLKLVYLLILLPKVDRMKASLRNQVHAPSIRRKVETSAAILLIDFKLRVHHNSLDRMIMWFPTNRRLFQINDMSNFLGVAYL